MNNAESLNPLKLSPVMPVVKIDSLEDALPLAEALLKGGISAIEVTLRTDCALEAMEAIAKGLPEMKVGAGTITRPEHIHQCRDAGALFGLSPGATVPLLEEAGRSDWPFVPGVATASEIMQALDYGFSQLKFFPAEASGGVKALKGLGGPFPQVEFCPTGGISLDNLRSYIRLSNVVCVGGTWLTPDQFIQEKNWSIITSLTAESIRLANS
ncbi:MAG: bifunctional 4-hydroxy-2-oxoglutarate aldolase/2-dehydro-3-deoxy-phosphogluconate aldolase [Ketobacteraceae bacterium]|nr:bifunctional 4-hydroxy-2-oxoglutarate aldolase/2-dehydro-3-deoxy-phosphogluconate aldolase [Ketobacteraceae bacterium]